MTKNRGRGAFDIGNKWWTQKGTEFSNPTEKKVGEI